MTDRGVFLSYRRKSSSFVARAVFQDLKASGYDVFMDVEEIDSGRFENIILNELGSRPHFIVVLSLPALQGCVNPDDWFRREIERAIELERNIIPLLIDGFRFEEASELLSGNFARLNSYNALNVPHDFFDEAMSKLKTRFLQQPTQQELRIRTAEEWFQTGERARETKEFEKANEAYTKAIELNPAMPEAFCNRAVTRCALEDYRGAVRDLDHAIALDPTSFALYKNRGDVKQRLGDMRGAIDDYGRAFNGGEEPEDDFPYY